MFVNIIDLRLRARTRYEVVCGDVRRDGDQQGLVPECSGLKVGAHGRSPKVLEDLTPPEVLQGKDRNSSRSPATPTRLNNTITLIPTTTTTAPTTTSTTTIPNTPTPTTAAKTTSTTTTITPNTKTTTSTTSATTTTTTFTMSSSRKDGGGGGGGGGGGARDLVTEARNFNSGLAHVLLLKTKRDQQSRHLLEKAQLLIEALIAENHRLQMSPVRAAPVATRQPRSAGGMGQLWVKLDELKRENDDLRRQRVRSSQDDRCSSPKDKGPGEVLINDLQKTKTDNESLKSHVMQLQKALREVQSVNATMQDEYKRSKAALDAAQRSVEKSRHDYRKLEVSFTALRAENEALKLRLTVAQGSPAKTSSIMAAPVPRTNNRLTENISERCRPSTVALRYTSLESQQWVDAKEAMEDDPQADLEEAHIVGLLCEGLMSAYAASQRLLTNVELVISELLRRPTLATSVIDNRLVANGQCSPLPEDLADIIKYRLRQTTDNIDTDVICSMAQEHQSPETRQALQAFSCSKVVRQYLQECACTTWQMALQNPPMTLVADDATFDDVRHKLWWSCDQSRAGNVDQFVWPALFDYEGGNILVKGCVCAS